MTEIKVILEQKEEKKKNLKKEIISFFKDLFIIILIVLFIRAFFVAPFQIKGPSMDTNFYDKEFILVNRLTTIKFPIIGQISPYQRGDVIVFEPRDKKGNLLHTKGEKVNDNIWQKFRRFIAWPEVTYIKRIIGLPGETVRIKDGLVFVKKVGDDKFVKLNEEYLNNINLGNTNVFGTEEQRDFVVPKGKYFVMGDNRIRSLDSRACFSSIGCNGDYTAFVDEKYIIGKVWFDLGYFNFSDFSFDNGKKEVNSQPRFLDFPKNYIYK